MSVLHRSSSTFLQSLARWSGLFAFVLFILLAPQTRAASGINSQINYQARLLDSSGSPVADGVYSLKLSLYDASNGGNRVWTAKGTTTVPTALSVTVTNGLLTVLLGDSSIGGGSQNALDDSIDWNSNNLYLGVSIGSDAEMTPRKHLAASPYAFNAERLQGMYASGTAFGANALFSINQASNTAATGTRTALLIKSKGTSSANDFLVRALNDTDAEIFSLNRQGNVTSTGYLTVTGSGTSTFSGALSVIGGVVLGDASSDVISANGHWNTDLLPMTDLAYGLGSSALRFNGYFGNVTSTNATTTWLGFSTATGTILNVATGTINTLTSQNVTLSGGTINGMTIGGVSPSTGSFTNLTASNATSGWLGFTTASGTSVYATNLNWANATGSNAVLTNLTVTGSCTGCGGGGGASSTLLLDSNTWTGANVFNGTSTFASTTFTGFVGVGTSTPREALDVVGNVRNVLSIGQPVLQISTTTVGVDPYSVAVSGKYAYTANLMDGTMSVVDVSNPYAPVVVGTAVVGKFPASVMVSGQYAYLANSGSSTMSIVDISNPKAPVQVGTTGVGGSPSFIAISGQYAYVVNTGETTVSVVDISNPAAPIQVGLIDVGSVPETLAISGRYGYVVNYASNNLSVFDVLDWKAPVHTVAVPFGPFAIAISGRYAYIANDGLNAMSVIDISDPSAPASVATLNLGFNPESIAVSGRYAYVTNAGSDSMSIVDVSNPAAPVLVTTASVGHYPKSVAVSGRYAYVVNGSSDNLAIFDVGGLETTSITGHSAELGSLQVLSDARVANQLTVGGGLNIGPGGIATNGSLTVSAANATSTFLGNLAVGTSTYSSMLNSLFTMSGHDLYVGGSIGSVSSVYTNGEFVAGAGSTHYADGSISKTDGNLTLSASGGFITPAVNQAVSLGAFDLRFNGYFGNVTSTNVTSTGWLGFATASGTTLNTLNLSVLGSTTSTFKSPTNFLDDVTIGGSTVATAPAYFSIVNPSSSANRFVVGPSQNMDVVIGGTTSSASNTLFQLTGRDLFVVGNIGSASSIYSNTAFIAGSGGANQASYAANSISLTNGNLALTVPGGFIFPPSAGAISLGKIDTTFNAYLNNVTSTNATSTNISVLHQLSGVLTSNSLATKVTSTIIGGSPMGVTVSGKYGYAVNQTSSTLSILDLTDGSNPVLVTSTFLGAGVSPIKVVVQGGYAYVANNGAPSTLITVDISNPAKPVIDSNFNSGFSGLSGLAANGRYVYVVDKVNGVFKIIDVMDSKNPLSVGSVSAPNNPTGLFVQGRYAYYLTTAGAAERLVTVDVSNPVLPAIVSNFVLGIANPSDVYVQGKYAFMSSLSDTSIRVANVANPTSVTLAGVFGIGVTSTSIVVQGRNAYVTAADGTLRIFDAIDPSATGGFSLVQSVNIAGDGKPQGVFPNGRYVYVTDSINKTFSTVDIGGVETSGLLAHSAELGNLQVTNNGIIGNNFSVGGGLNIGSGGLLSNGPLAVSASGTFQVASFVNRAAANSTTTWGAYINRLLVGDVINATGTSDFASIITYDGASKAGLCLDDISGAETCVAGPGVSIQADGAINANAFDLAEQYQLSGQATAGDVLSLDPGASSTVKLSPGVPYDPKVIGIASTKPGFLLGHQGGISVALAGRVPTKVSLQNGPIVIGDLLTTSPYPGLAMKALSPGMVIGRALENANTTSTIEVFVHVGYDAGQFLTTNHELAQANNSLIFAPTSTAGIAQATANSWGLAFRGSAWDGVHPVTTEFALSNTVINATSSQFTIASGTSTLFTLDLSGTAKISGDLAVGGKLFPSARGTMQNSTYLFVDDSQGPTSTYIATNAAGWQSDDSYDFAERYYSPDKLEPGDLVVVSERGQSHVQRSLDEKQMLVGIVSTKPGFVAGRPATSTYPIALMGRVPTKVSNVKGAIHAGDLLAPSSIPGIAVKATQAGPVVGQALEAWNGSDIGSIEVFVNPIWWGGNELAQTNTQTAPQAQTVIIQAPVAPKSYQGFAKIMAGASKIHVTYPSLMAYPNVQLTPHGEVDEGFWTENNTDIGFDILLKKPQTHDVTFAWQVLATQTGQTMFLSDGTSAIIDPLTGNLVEQTLTTSTQIIPPAASSTESIAPPNASSTPVSFSEPAPSSLPGAISPEVMLVPSSTPESSASSSAP